MVLQVLCSGHLRQAISRRGEARIGLGLLITNWKGKTIIVKITRELFLLR